MKAKIFAALLSALFITGCGGDNKKPADGSKTVSKKPNKDIVEVAVAAGDFKTLVKALKAAGLVETLKSQGPFTVFAPNDAAFAKLPAGALDGLLKDKAKLTKVLLYHVVPGRVPAAEVVKRSKVVTAADEKSLDITSSGGLVKVNDATIVKTDIPATNGLIHVIDTVLTPK